MVMVAAEEQQFHVLAVDDSLLDRKLIERLLRTSSYQVTTVDSGSKALEFLGFLEDEGSKPNQPCVSPNNQIEQQQISLSPMKKDVGVNLIITDYCMPEMTGYDLLKKIKESSSLRNIPVVIMSSENIPSRISRCLEEGAEEFLLKPVRLSDVSKLKPHLLRTKYVGEEQEILNQLNEGHDDLQVALIAPQQKQKQQQQQQLQLQQQLQQQPDAQHEKQQIKQDQQNNNKRKSSEEGISVERTSHRYSGLNYCSLT